MDGKCYLGHLSAHFRILHFDVDGMKKWVGINQPPLHILPSFNLRSGGSKQMTFC